MLMGSRRVAPLLFGVLIFSACAEAASPSRELFDRYLAASNDHDLKVLETLAADDIVWRLGPWTLKGKDQVMALHYADLINHTSLEAREVVVRGDTVECVLIERNDATRAYGADSLLHYPRYVFRDGLVVLKEAWRRDPGVVALNRYSAPFRAWVRETHPESLALILDSTGTPRWTRAAVREKRRMLEAWIAAGKPGLGPG